MTKSKKGDACTRKVKARVAVWPSARASQQVAKCRKAKGQVRKTKKGSDLNDGKRKIGKTPRPARNAEAAKKVKAIADQQSESAVKRPRLNQK